MRRSARMWGVRSALLAMLALFPGLAAASTLGVMGNQRWDEARVRAAAGQPPSDIDALPEWADDALARVLAAYGRDGYTAARGWTRVTGDHVDLEVDEGVIARVAFRGPNSLVKLMLARAVELPDKVFHEPTVAAQLEQLQQVRGLAGAAFHVDPGDEWVKREIPGAVRSLTLIIEMQTVEQEGFGFDLRFDPVYGIVARPSWAIPDLAADGDRFYTSAGLAFPLHEYVWETDPKLRWVYGDVGVEYRMRPIGQSVVSPRFTVYADLIQQPRIDRRLAQLMTESALVRADLVFSWVERWIFWAGPIFGQWAVLRTLYEEGADPLPEPLLDDVARIGVQIGFDGKPPSAIVRTDLRPRLKADAVIGWSSANDVFFRTDTTLRGVLPVGVHQLVVGFHGAAVLGDVRTYDALRVAGQFQRTYFKDLYYTRLLAQFEADLRFKLIRDLHAGAYVQQSVFEDRVEDVDEPEMGFMNSFGPGIHLLIENQFAIDAYWAFGVGPRTWPDNSPHGSRYSQTVSFGLQSVY